MPPTDPTERDPFAETVDGSRAQPPLSPLPSARSSEHDTPPARPGAVRARAEEATAAGGGPPSGALTPVQRFRPRLDGDAAFLQTEVSLSTPAAAVVTLPPRFMMVRSLGSGGMGEVVLAQDKVLGRDVAIKVLRQSAVPEGDTRGRLLDEAQAAAQIRHPHIVNIHDVDLDLGLIVMEYLPQGSMRKVLEERGRLPIREVLRCARQLCAALGAAHAAGLVHRDIKPDNVLLDADGSIKLADFGVAQSRRRTTSGHTEIVGTPAYMAPEQLRGASCDARADIYSLGLTFFEFATGRRFHTPDGAADTSIDALTEAVGDRGLASVLSRCLGEDPGHRYPTAQALDAALEGLEKRRQRLRFMGAATLLSLLVAVPVVLYVTKSPAQSPAALLKMAVVPLQNRTTEPALEWLKQGLANLLSSALRRRNVTAVRHTQLRDLAGTREDEQSWADAAKTLGANEIVSGEFVRAGLELQVTVRFREHRYVARGRASRADSLADDLASQIARALVGEEGTPQRKGRSPEAMRAFELGYAALQQHEFQRATDLLREAVRRDPDYVDARYALITALLSYPTTTVNIAAEVDQALARSPGKREKALFEALKLRVLRRYEEAAARYDRLRAEYPTEKEAHYGLADSLFHLGRADQAMAAFKQLVRLAPGFHLAYQHPVDYYATRAQWRELNAFLYFLRRAAPPPQFLANMEMRFELAKKGLSKARERGKTIANPGPELLSVIASVQALVGDLEGAREAYAQASAQTPENWELRIGRAALDLTQGHIADFHSDVAWETSGNESLSIVANRIATRGLLYAALGRVEEARRDLEEVQATAGSDTQRRLPRVAYLEGLLALISNDASRAEEARKRLAPTSSKERPARLLEVQSFVSAVLSALREGPAAGLRRLTEAFKLREDGFFAPVVLVAMARLALSAREPARAAAHCDDVVLPTAYSPLRAPSLPVCLGILARTKSALGKPEEAKQHARALLELWKHSAVEMPEIRWARDLLGDEAK